MRTLDPHQLPLLTPDTTTKPETVDLTLHVRYYYGIILRSIDSVKMRLEVG